jgi:soluble lytic murein transglycosylase-like protein
MDMKIPSLMLIPLNSASELFGKFKKRSVVANPALEAAKLAFILPIALFFLLEYFSPAAQMGLRLDFSNKIRKFFSFTKSAPDPVVQEVLNLTNMIQLITEDRLSQSKALRYAGLISQASQRYEVNPVEIIALIVAESGFKENVINRKTGDYGLGQINWEHWGKPNELTPQDLLDPAINIFMTCHVYKFFDRDAGRYHRGNGIKSKAYVTNIKSILATLNAFAGLNKEEIS